MKKILSVMCGLAVATSMFAAKPKGPVTINQGKRIIDSAKRKADIFRFLNRVSVCCLL